ncbi:MAG: MBL fold metallo-hydrolase [Acidimicrobiales bacterium]
MASTPTGTPSTTLQVTITGTGVPIPAPGTAGPGVLVRTGDHVMQFDVGRGTVGRLADAGVPPRSVSTVFVTHHHSDHLVGLVDLVMTRWVMDHAGHEPLEIVAPVGPAIDYLQEMLEPWRSDLDVRRQHTERQDLPDPVIVAFEPSDTPNEVWVRDGVRVLSVGVHHEPVLPAVAYRVESAAGAVVISGDTRVCDEVAKLAAGADVVVHEACRAQALRALFGDTPQIEHIVDYHADTVELGALAERVGIPHLMLTHLIPPPADDEQREQFAADVRRGGYTGEITVAQDLSAVVIGG